MHWGQIKSLLILSFFILDIYLLAQFLEKKELSDIAIQVEQTSTIEEQLKAESITLMELPEQEYEETYISVKQRAFKKDELLVAKDQIKQHPLLLNNYLIASKLDEPFQINKDDSQEKITEVFNHIVYFPEEYTFWGWDEELQIIIFFQNKMDRPVYYNQNGLVLLFLNQDNEIIYYTQTMLGDADALAEKQKLIKPMQAIEELYGMNELYSGDAITNVHIGFHTRMPFESGVQVFAPVWKLNVNDEEDFFVNAIEGFTFSTQERGFLLETIDLIIEKMQSGTEKGGSLLEEMMDDLIMRVIEEPEQGGS